MTIGQRIKEARKNAGLTQRGLAEKSGTATGTIQQYELCKRQPRIGQLRAIADALEIDVSYFIGETPNLEDAKAHWRETMADELQFKHVLKIIEDLYGKCGSRSVQGRWGYDVFETWGDGADAIAIRSENLDAIVDAIQSLTISLVDSFKVSADDYANEIRKELSSDSYRDAMRDFFSESPTAPPESTPPAREGKDTTPPSDAPETPPEGK